MTPFVCIGIPHTGLVTMEWAIAFRNLILPCPTMYGVERGRPIDVSRNEIVANALKSPVTHIFFLDSDVIPPPNALVRLLSHDLPIVSGLYWSKYGFPFVMREGKDGLFEPMKRVEFGKLIEVDAIPMGCALIKREVFERMGWPWFKMEVGKEPLGVSEDYWFCKRARELGYKIYVDTGVLCGHVTLAKFDGYGRLVQLEI